MRLTRLLATSAVLGASIVGFGATPANAAVQTCDRLYFSGYSTVILPTDEGGCVPLDAGLCDYEAVPVEPFFYFSTAVCAPQPVAEPAP